MNRSPIHPSGKSEVYLWRSTAVKWNALVLRGVAAVLLAVAVLSAGCVAPSTNAPAAARFEPLGVWYSVETAAAATAPLARTLNRDFGNIRKMDLNAVFVRHCDPDDWPIVAEAGAEHGLALIAPDPAAIRYVRSGSSRGDWFADMKTSGSSSVAACYLGEVVDAETYARARRLADAARRATPPIMTCVSFGADANYDGAVFDYVVRAEPTDADVRTAAPALATVVCREHRRDEEATVRGWLASFHLGLLRGDCGGVVFDAYRALPGNWHGIVRQNSPPSPERTAMLRRIIARAKRWPGLLAGLEPQPIEVRGALPTEVRTALLTDGKSVAGRQYLMVVNTSPTRFVRTTATFSPTTGSAAVTRAVTVTTAEDTMIGQVYPARHGELKIPLQLPPGEAKLFELF